MCVCDQVLDSFMQCMVIFKFVFFIIIKYLNDIEVDYGYEVLDYSKDVREIVISYDV